MAERESGCELISPSSPRARLRAHAQAGWGSMDARASQDSRIRWRRILIPMQHHRKQRCPEAPNPTICKTSALRARTQPCGATAGRTQLSPIWQKRWRTVPRSFSWCCFLLSFNFCFSQCYTLHFWSIWWMGCCAAEKSHISNGSVGSPILSWLPELQLSDKGNGCFTLKIRAAQEELPI